MNSTRGGSLLRPRGVSLIELIITVLVIGILAAVAAPKFSQALGRARAEGVARRIAADLNYARRVAKLQSKQCTVTFTLAPASYQMTGVAHPDHPSQSYAVTIGDLESGVTLVSADFNSTRSITFNEYGAPLAGSPLAALAAGAVIVRSGSDQFTVAVDPNTGEASVL